MQLSAYFTKGFLLVRRSWCHHEGTWCFSRYEEMQGLGLWNQFLQTPYCLKTCSTSCPGAQSAPSPPWAPLRACGRSAAAAARGPVSTEADGRGLGGAQVVCPWRVPVRGWQSPDHSLILLHHLVCCCCLQLRSHLGSWVLWFWLPLLYDHRCSVPQSCLTLCEPMGCSTPGSPVLHHLPELAQTHAHWVSDAIQPSHLLPSPSPPAFSLFQDESLI